MKFEKNGKRIKEYSNYTNDINAIWDGLVKQGLVKQAYPRRPRLAKTQARLVRKNEI